MDALKNIMRVIDDNSHNLSEGDYLTLCNLLKNVYKSKNSQQLPTLFDYENFIFFIEDHDNDVSDYFYDYYYSESLANDEDFYRLQITYLQSELKDIKPIKRLSKITKTQAIKHYCLLHNIVLEEYDEVHIQKYCDDNQIVIGDIDTMFSDGIKKLYTSYILVENYYREIYRNSIRQRIQKLNACIDDLYD